ncbi:MAG: YdcF family protein [Stellaceae bacterium]
MVVLGCRLRADGTASLTLRRRVTRGIEVFRQGMAPVLVLSGGGAGSVPESEVMRTLARDAGVPEAALLVEPRSRNTFENARETAQLLHARGINAVILVSDRVHLPRATLLFRHAGLKVAGRAAAAPPAPLRELVLGLREAGAFARTLWLALLRRPYRERP